MTDAAMVLDVKTSIDNVGTGIRKEKRKEIADRLSEVLTGSYLLVLKSHLYHWNEVGPLFHPLHKMTEEHYEKIFDACDEIAERIRALGFPAALSTKLFETGSRELKPTGFTSQEMIEALVRDHEALCRTMRKVAASAEEADDFVTHDLMTGRLAYHEKVVWMLRATLAD